MICMATIIHSRLVLMSIQLCIDHPVRVGPLPRLPEPQVSQIAQAIQSADVLLQFHSHNHVRVD
jgi:hypothetical protein